MELKKVEVREYLIKEVSTEDADVIISKDKNVYDFMAIGVACIRRTIKGERDLIIKVSVGKICSSIYKAGGLKDVQSVDLKGNAFMLCVEEIKEIARYLASGIQNKLVKDIVIAMAMTIPQEFTLKVEVELEENLPITIPEFDGCLDTVKAQMGAIKLFEEFTDIWESKVCEST